MSMMLSVLPNSIQSRLPKVPSIRRTMTSPMRNGYPSPPLSSGSVTPVSEAEEFMDPSKRDMSVAAEPYESLRQKADGLPGLDVVKKSPSGVDWRSGRQGKKSPPPPPPTAKSAMGAAALVLTNLRTQVSSWSSMRRRRPAGVGVPTTTPHLSGRFTLTEWLIS